MIVAFFAALSGFSLVDWLMPGLHWLGKWAVALLLGLGLSTYGVFILNRLGLPISLWSFGLILLLGLVVGLVRHRSWFASFRPARVGQSLRAEFSLTAPWGVVVPTLALLVAIVIFGLYWPVRDWDALTLYDFRAKVMTQTGQVTFLESTDANYYFAYPLFTSLMHTLVYLGDVSSPMVLYSLIFVAFVVLFYVTLQKQIDNQTISFLAIFLLVSSPIMLSHTLMAYTNLPYAVFLISAFMLLMQWVEHQTLKGLILVSILGGLSVWVRDAEPFWVLIPLGIGFFAKRHKLELTLVSLGLILSFYVPWSHYRQTVLANYAYTKTVVSLAEGLQNISPTYLFQFIGYWWKFFLKPYAPIHLVFGLMVVRYLLGNRSKAHQAGILLLLGVYGLILAGTVYMSLTYEKWLRVGGSLERMSIFLVPLTYYLAALQWKRDHAKK